MKILHLLYESKGDYFGIGGVGIRAYGEFCNAVSGIRLVIAGDGRDREKFSGLTESLPGMVKKNIELKGWVEGDEKNSLLKNALLVVMPSRYETQGIVALDAMALGKAVIVSDIPELSYVTRNRAGLSFKTGNAVSLAQSMKDLVASNERREMGQRGRDWVSHYTWENVALKYEGFLKTVLEVGS